MHKVRQYIPRRGIHWVEEMNNTSKDINIFIVEDNKSLRDSLIDNMEAWGWRASGVARKEGAISEIKKRFFNVALVDLNLPDGSGLDVLKAIKESNSDTMVIIMTAYASLDSSIEAINQGAYSYIIKPCNMDAVKISISHALEKQRLIIENKRLMEELVRSNKELREKIRELKETQDKLIQAGRLVAVGELAAGVAHEINNPLAAVLGSVQMAMKYYLNKEKIGEDDVKKSAELLTVAVKESHRAKNIIMNLLDFSREKEIVIMPCKLEDIIDESIPLVGHQVDLLHINIVKEFPKDLPKANVDRDQMKQVFINLFLNAVQAMPKGGTLQISGRAEGEKVIVNVSDTGCGIKEGDIPKIYDPFFTTKVPGKGAGLGLAVTYGIIKRLEGNIEVESQVGKGTTFTLTLPASKVRG